MLPLLFATILYYISIYIVEAIISYPIEFIICNGVQPTAL